MTCSVHPYCSVRGIGLVNKLSACCLNVRVKLINYVGMIKWHECSCYQ